MTRKAAKFDAESDEVLALGRYYGTSSVAMPVAAPIEEQDKQTA